LSLSSDLGDTGSVGLGISYHSNLFGTGKNGFEIRSSFLLNVNDNISIGTNLWTGLGALSEFNQRTGVLQGSFGDFNFSYENDSINEEDF